MFLFHLPFMLLYLAACYAYSVDPSESPLWGVLGLIFPVVLGVQLLFTGYWIYRGTKFAILSTVVLLLGWSHFGALFQLNGNKIDHNEEGSLRIMTYNIHYWQSYLNADLDSTRTSLAEMITGLDPDILFLQENIQIDAFEKLNYPYKYHVRMTQHTSYGLGFASKYPIIAQGEVNYTRERGGYQKFAWADIQIDSVIVRAVNVHMVNTSLRPESYQTLAGNTSSELTGEKLEEEGKDIYRRLRDSYAIRGSQVRDLTQFISESPYPIVLAGDFNDTPTGFVYRQIADQLNDAFISSGQGSGDSYNKLSVVPLRIDYIFTDPVFENVGFTVVKSDWSDHKPVVSDFKLTTPSS